MILWVESNRAAPAVRWESASSRVATVVPRATTHRSAVLEGKHCRCVRIAQIIMFFFFLMIRLQSVLCADTAARAAGDSVRRSVWHDCWHSLAGTEPHRTGDRQPYACDTGKQFRRGVFHRERTKCCAVVGAGRWRSCYQSIIKVVYRKQTHTELYWHRTCCIAVPFQINQYITLSAPPLSLLFQTCSTSDTTRTAGVNTQKNIFRATLYARSFPYSNNTPGGKYCRFTMGKPSAISSLFLLTKMRNHSPPLRSSVTHFSSILQTGMVLGWSRKMRAVRQMPPRRLDCGDRLAEAAAVVAALHDTQAGIIVS